MITVESLTAERRTVSVNYGSEALTVTYRPAVYTPEFARGVREMPVAEFLERLLDRWDVRDGDAPYPTTVSAIERLPLAFVRAVERAILVDVHTPPKVQTEK